MAKNPPELKTALAELEAHAASIRSELKVPKQNDVFRVAVEAGYLTALADGEVDAAERATMVRAVDLLSAGAVIEWETEALLEECEARAAKDGAAKRAAAVGESLAALGQAEAGAPSSPRSWRARPRGSTRRKRRSSRSWGRPRGSGRTRSGRS